MTIKKYSYRADIISEILFGSKARGDDDKNSDTDILLVINDLPHEQQLKLKKIYAQENGIEEEYISIMSLNSLKKFTTRGSLFVWHLKLEGKIKYDRFGISEKVLKSMKKKPDYIYELSKYEIALNRLIDESNEENYIATTVDYYLMMVIIRNLCTILTDIDGCPIYSKTKSFEKVKNKYKIDLSNKDFELILKWYMCYTRGEESDKELPSIEETKSLILKTKKLTELTKVVIKNEK